MTKFLFILALSLAMYSLPHSCSAQSYQLLAGAQFVSASDFNVAPNEAVTVISGHYFCYSVNTDFDEVDMKSWLFVSANQIGFDYSGYLTWDPSGYYISGEVQLSATISGAAGDYPLEARTYAKSMSYSAIHLYSAYGWLHAH